MCKQKNDLILSHKWIWDTWERSFLLPPTALSFTLLPQFQVTVIYSNRKPQSGKYINVTSRRDNGYLSYSCSLFWVVLVCVCVCVVFLLLFCFFLFLASFIALLGNHLLLLYLKLMSYFPLVISDWCRLTIFSKQLFIVFHLYVSIPPFPFPVPKFTNLLHV